MSADSDYLKTYYLNPEEVYSIGVHRCGRMNKIENIDELAGSIFNNGLIFETQEGAGLTGTVYMKGSTNFEEKLDESVEELYRKVDENSLPAGVIVAVPGSIKGKDGKDYYLGTYPDDLDYIAKDDKRLRHLPIENFVRTIRRVPKEFILGILIKYNDKTLCIGNSNYISHLSEEEQAELLEQYKEQGLELRDFNDIKLLSERTAKLLGDDFYIGEKYLKDSCIKYEIDREVQRKKFADWQRLSEIEKFELKEMLKETEQEDKNIIVDSFRK